MKAFGAQFGNHKEDLNGQAIRNGVSIAIREFKHEDELASSRLPSPLLKDTKKRDRGNGTDEGCTAVIFCKHDCSKSLPL
jgi:hypothetical protein